MIHGYKIVRPTDDCTIFKTLFHPIEGSKLMCSGEWLKASVKRVRDGSGGTYYDSGIHVLPSLTDALTYIQNFKDLESLTIVSCKVDGEVREKKHSRSPVMLSERIKIINEVVVIYD